MSILTEILVGVHADLRTWMAEVRLVDLRREAASRYRRVAPDAVATALRGDDIVRLIPEVKRICPTRGQLAAIDRPGSSPPSSWLAVWRSSC